MAETDLLQRFMCGGGGTRFPAKPKDETLEHGRPENVELSLGLSLNGRFGPEPQRVMPIDNNNNNNKLFRASSVVDFVNFPADVELSLHSPVTRTCSLPPETEAEWRERKELQTFRRSEAKRKREEKLKNVRVVKQSPPAPVPAPAMHFSSQGSIVSQGSGGSSGVSDFESQRCPGINKDTEVKSTTHECSTPNQVPSKIISGFIRSRKADASIDPPIKNSSEKPSQLANAHLPTDMPYVSTKGDGPNGKKVQGFLYRYGKGEEVRILCVCHGTFLTPAEFVKHGGGGDVDHPLRHIIVSSSFS